MERNNIQDKSTTSDFVQNNRNDLSRFVGRIRQVAGPGLYSFCSNKSFLLVFFVFAFFEIISVSGIAFGWSLIETVFKRKGFYSILCKDVKGNTHADSNNSVANGSFQGRFSNGNHELNIIYFGSCSAQNERLNLIFTVSLVCLCASNFVIGYFVDTYGPRAAQVVGCLLYAIAGVGLAFTTRGLADLLFPIFICFSVGGSFSALAIFQVTNIIFGRVKSLVLTVFEGAFDSSATVLLIFKVLHDHGYTLKNISLVYTSICVVLIGVITFCLMPSFDKLQNLVKKQRDDKKQLLSDESDEEWISAKKKYGSIKSGSLNSNSHQPTTVELYTAPNTFLESAKSPMYILELVFVCITQLRIWFFVGSLDRFLKVITGNVETSVDNYINIFGYAQFCGMAVCPIIGLVFDRNTIFPKVGNLATKVLECPRLQSLKDCVLPFAITNTMCMIFSALTLSPWLAVVVPSIILQVIVRGFLFGCHAAFIGIAFRPEFYGRLYGLGIFVGGIFSFSQYVLFVITEGPLHGDPFWMNLAFLILVIAAYVFPVYLWFYCRRLQQSRYKTTIQAVSFTLSTAGHEKETENI